MQLIVSTNVPTPDPRHGVLNANGILSDEPQAATIKRAGANPAKDKNSFRG